MGWWPKPNGFDVLKMDAAHFDSNTTTLSFFLFFFWFNSHISNTTTLFLLLILLISIIEQNLEGFYLKVQLLLGFIRFKCYRLSDNLNHICMSIEGNRISFPTISKIFLLPLRMRNVRAIRTFQM